MLLLLLLLSEQQTNKTILTSQEAGIRCIYFFCCWRFLFDTGNKDMKTLDTQSALKRLCAVYIHAMLPLLWFDTYSLFSAVK